MSQYIAKDGFANDWHFAHLSRFALGGAGIIFTEASAVEKNARRTHGDLGLWLDAHIEPLARIVSFLKSQGTIAGIQLAHAGRKASERRPWHGETPVDEEDSVIRDEQAWPAFGPTAEPYAEAWPTPQVMSLEDIQNVISQFRDAAKRALEADFDVIEVYAAHGFLLHQFYSPISNTRQDAYGGDFDGRIRLCLEVAEAIRDVWPDERALFFRLSSTDWVDGGWTIDDTVELAKQLKIRGVDVIDCSSGALGGKNSPPPERMPLGPAFQTSFSESVKQEADMLSMTVGMIWGAAVADGIIREGKADLVALGREALYNPNWTLHAAMELGVDEDFSLWRPEFGWWLNKRERLIQRLNLRDNENKE